MIKLVCDHVTKLFFNLAKSDILSQDVDFVVFCIYIDDYTHFDSFNL